MGKTNLLAKPRGGITIHVTKRQARKVLRALEGPSVTDEELSGVYYALKQQLED